ncbi:glycoside hydrolase superfamily [Triangularia setosa]|uniref:chitinase n=1 Tax=Triangularia setosa TaxID=2587417 RepID=A0AAN6VXC7_9PEZI|nr:glycoside hydrolase superfamily [Podospora setosa]
MLTAAASTTPSSPSTVATGTPSAIRHPPPAHPGRPIQIQKEHVKLKICLSEGTPPMPTVDETAVCGPTAHEFCSIANSTTANLSTTTCVSNCGNDIILSPAPASQMRIAYFEAWSGNRPCLRTNVDQIDTSKYTHIHFAFAEVSPSFQVVISDVQDDWDRFMAMKGVKTIISFGGWDFSVLPGTYRILRDAVKPANRKTFRKNVVDFVIQLGWPRSRLGVPWVSRQHAHSRLSRRGTELRHLASKCSRTLPRSKSKWDVGNKYAIDGCEAGNCPRPHVNITETMGALSMITKAGMLSNKVVVGVTSYERSFRMAQKDCVGPMCTFTGIRNDSHAAPGRCTGTKGYISDAEIADIIRFNPTAKTWQQYMTDYLVYNDFDWVAYMSNENKDLREILYELLHMGGSTDWAVDLQSFDPEFFYGNDPMNDPAREHWSSAALIASLRPWMSSKTREMCIPAARMAMSSRTSTTAMMLTPITDNCYKVGGNTKASCPPKASQRTSVRMEVKDEMAFGDHTMKEFSIAYEGTAPSITAYTGSAAMSAYDIAKDLDNLVLGIFFLLVDLIPGVGTFARGTWHDGAIERQDDPEG